MARHIRNGERVNASVSVHENSSTNIAEERVDEALEKLRSDDCGNAQRCLTNKPVYQSESPYRYEISSEGQRRFARLALTKTDAHGANNVKPSADKLRRVFVGSAVTEAVADFLSGNCEMINNRDGRDGAYIRTGEFSIDDDVKLTGVRRIRTFGFQHPCPNLWVPPETELSDDDILVLARGSVEQVQLLGYALGSSVRFRTPEATPGYREENLVVEQDEDALHSIEDLLAELKRGDR